MVKVEGLKINIKTSSDIEEVSSFIHKAVLIMEEYDKLISENERLKRENFDYRDKYERILRWYKQEKEDKLLLRFKLAKANLSLWFKKWRN